MESIKVFNEETQQEVEIPMVIAKHILKMALNVSERYSNYIRLGQLTPNGDNYYIVNENYFENSNKSTFMIDKLISEAEKQKELIEKINNLTSQR